MKPKRIPSVFRFGVALVVLAWAVLAPQVWSASSLPEQAPAAPAKKADDQSEFQRLYGLGIQAIESQKYQKAYDYFWRASRIRKNNPEVLNMLAFSQRKLGNLDEAFRYYKMALQLKPQFPQAREYLGEAHIQAALEQISLLKSYGPTAAHELEDLVAAFQSAAEKLQPSQNQGERK